MEKSIEIKSIFENSEKLEINALFQEIIAKAEENKKIAEEQWKEMPGENNELDLELYSQFWNIWSKYDSEEFKNKLPLLWNKAVENYNKFVKENRWETAENWEMSENDQFMHLIEEIEKEFRQRLNDLK